MLNLYRTLPLIINTVFLILLEYIGIYNHFNYVFEAIGTYSEILSGSIRPVSCSNGEDISMPPVETVWGGEGEEYVSSVECETNLYFEKINRENIRSSWSSGQIPLLYYI